MNPDLLLLPSLIPMMTPVSLCSNDVHLVTVAEPHIASSIHAIYRPVAWLRRVGSTLSIRSAKQSVQGESDSDVDMNAAFEDDADADDFETSTPRPADVQKPESLPTSTPIPMAPHLSTSLKRRAASRSGSMATVKVNRRARLAEKLREIFDIDVLSEVWAGKYHRAPLV